MTTVNAEHIRRRIRLLRLAGAVMMAAGAALAYLAIIEMYCFYLFGEDGRFAYAGFGFGSFMFGNIAAQVVGYYAIAVVLLGLGYGHLRPRSWARMAVLVLMRVWLVVGLPAVIAVFGILLASKDVSVAVAASIGVCLALAYAVMPWIVIRLYNSRSARLAFEPTGHTSAAVEAGHLSVLTLVSLLALYVLALHSLVLFNGLFPFFGRWLTGLQGIQALACSILALAAIAWGTLVRHRLAWWAALLYIAIMTFSLVLTLVRSTYADLLVALDLPPTELEILDGLPFQGYHLAVFVGLPLVVTLLMIVRSRRHFDAPVSRSPHLLAERQGRHG